jgi:glucose 1-dehydrogenase
VSPGSVNTPIWGGALDRDPAFKAREADATALKRIAEPEDIARVVVFLLSDDAAYITGEDLLVDGGYSTTAESHEPRPPLRSLVEHPG